MPIAPAVPSAEERASVLTVSRAVVEGWRRALLEGSVPASSSDLADLLASLEDLKAVACAVQAGAAVALDRSERERQAAAGLSARRRGVGVAAQVGLARRESPHRGAVLLGAAKVWTTEMPHTLTALRHGRVSEYQAVLLVQETACLEREDRARIDELLCADPETLEGVGARQMSAMARRLAAQLDPAAVVRRARRAESERCVTLRPAPDSMTYLTALLPMAQGVAAYAALARAADLDVASGASALDAAPRGRGQIMADTLVERLTGQTTAAAVPVTVNLVMSDAALLGAGHEPGHLQGAGPVPAQVARELVAAGLDGEAAWLRRLYADPGGDLVAMSSKSRFHPDGLAEFLRIRDQGICRTPYCGAPIRHIDHVVGVASGGATSAANGEGLCVACNLAKEAPGWHRRTVSDGDADVGSARRGDCDADVGSARRGDREDDMGSARRGDGRPSYGIATLGDGDGDGDGGGDGGGGGRTGSARRGDVDGSAEAGHAELGGARSDRRAHLVETTTPTGHRYRSRAPRMPEPARSARSSTSMDRPIVPDGEGIDRAEQSVIDLWFGALVADLVEFVA
ncbi:MAG TPA: DUF222 domain-containing protein [Cellulomonas sp.]|nr:DUF222 domain-containing protein [Cellulomonas sp.]